tara:strand:- start:204 stop:389 length:186 start_codon:yes stop_codon:yes gene_type:complete
MTDDNLVSEAAVSLLKRQLLFVDIMWERPSNHRNDSDWQPEFFCSMLCPENAILLHILTPR